MSTVMCIRCKLCGEKFPLAKRQSGMYNSVHNSSIEDLNVKMNIFLHEHFGCQGGARNYYPNDNFEIQYVPVPNEED